MRILVAFKTTPDFDAIRASEWAAAPEQGRVETAFVPRVVSYHDECALEWALRVADAFRDAGSPVVLHAVTIGERGSIPHLETLLALGYERAELVETGASLDFEPGAVASLLAAAARRGEGYDLILLGGRAGPADSGMVPWLVAEALELPCVTGALGLEPLSSAELRVTISDHRGYATATVRPPLVLGVGDAVVRLRVPTLKMRLERKGFTPETVTPAGLGVDLAAALGGVGPRVLGFELPSSRRAGEVVEGVDPRDKARRLFERHLRERLTRL